MEHAMPYRIALAASVVFAFAMAGQAAEPERPNAPAAPGAYRPGEMMAPVEGVVATVDGRTIRTEDIADAVRQLPDDKQRIPFDALYPALLQDAVNHESVLVEALRQNLNNDPDVRRRMQHAADRALENEFLNRVVQKQLTDAAIQERYDRDYGSLKGIEQRRLRVIIVPDRPTAMQVEDALNHGADFATLARQRSVDPSSINGGEVGFVERNQLPPALAGSVFGQDIDEVSSEPISNNGRWYIVKVEEQRLAPVPPLDQVRGAIQRELVTETIDQTVAQARAKATIHMFNIDGTPFTPTSAEFLGDPLKFEVGGTP